MKYSFKNDYSETAHPRILRALSEVSYEQNEGYGEDKYSQETAKIINEQLGYKDADIHFVSGGTQANLVSLAAILKPFESVIAAESAHINVHEAGAIEAVGRKIEQIPSEDGKITPEKIIPIVEAHMKDHMTLPRAVFISNATEIGTTYTKEEITNLSQYCRSHDLYLYMDGARLGSALQSWEIDLTMRDLGNLVDMLYIGGTKNGALFGEAIVILNNKIKKDFRYHMKQRGALLAKTQSVSIQFKELFKDGLFFELAENANTMAARLTQGILGCEYDFLAESQTNQIFPIFPNYIINELQKEYGFYIWKQFNNDTAAIRLVTSWATNEHAVDMFVGDLEKLK